MGPTGPCWDNMVDSVSSSCLHLFFSSCSHSAYNLSFKYLPPTKIPPSTRTSLIGLLARVGNPSSQGEGAQCRRPSLCIGVGVGVDSYPLSAVHVFPPAKILVFPPAPCTWAGRRQPSPCLPSWPLVPASTPAV